MLTNKQRLETPKRKASTGEVVFDRTVYTGIGLVGNEALSLWVADQFMHGEKNLFAKVPGLKKAGELFKKEGYDRASKKFTEVLGFSDKVSVNGHKMLALERGGNSLMMVTLIAGGTMLILPMKWLEDNEGYWVKKANHMVDKIRGSKLSQEEVAARDDEVEQHIACSPRQSWPSMMFGRVIAVGSSIFTGTFIMGPERNEKLMNWTEKTFTRSTQPKGQKTTLHRYVGLAGVETYSAGLASIVLEVMSKMFAKHNAVPHDPELCKDKGDVVTSVSSSADVDTKTTDTKYGGHHSAKIQAQREQAESELMQAQI